MASTVLLRYGNKVTRAPPTLGPAAISDAWLTLAD